jgi:adenylate cyclase
VAELSDGAGFAIHVAECEAACSGHDLVEPGHLFLGVCSLGKMISPDLQRPHEISDDLMAKLRAEWDALSGVFSRADAHPVSLRRAIRQRLGAKEVEDAGERHPGPSESSKSVLAHAGALAQQREAPAAGLIDLLAALLDSGNDIIVEILEKQAVDIAMLRAAAVNPVKPAHGDLAFRVTGERLPDDLFVKTLQAISQREDVSKAVSGVVPAATPETAGRLALLCELSLLVGREATLESLLQTILERLREVIPRAEHGAFLVKDWETGELLLKAHVPVGNVAVTMTLAQQAMDQRQAFIWPPGTETPTSALIHDSPERPSTIVMYHIQSAIYAPLMWEGEALGVLCVDNCEKTFAFESGDLQLLQAVSHHAAMAVAQRKVQDELREHVELLSRLMSGRFPPKIRKKLMREASSGTMPSAHQSHITVLTSDIRGFTLLTERLGARRMSDLLNEYFPPLIEAIFANEGTVERYVGDAVFAVFGSPEADDRQHEHAVRAAMGMLDVVKTLNARRQALGTETCEIGIGIDCGTALHGFIGNAERMEFAVIGGAANRASRYCNGAAGGEVLISPEMHGHLFRIVRAQPVTIPTKHEGNHLAYRVVSLKEP